MRAARVSGSSSRRGVSSSVAMGNSVTFAGSGETDGGLTVNASFELDQGAGDGTGPFDSHSVSVGSDTLANMMTFWAEEYKRIYPNVNIQIQAAGSSTAPPALT